MKCRRISSDIDIGDRREYIEELMPNIEIGVDARTYKEREDNILEVKITFSNHGIINTTLWSFGASLGIVPPNDELYDLFLSKTPNNTSRLFFNQYKLINEDYYLSISREVTNKILRYFYEEPFMECLNALFGELFTSIEEVEEKEYNTEEQKSALIEIKKEEERYGKNLNNFIKKYSRFVDDPDYIGKDIYKFIEISPQGHYSQTFALPYIGLGPFRIQIFVEAIPYGLSFTTEIEDSVEKLARYYELNKKKEFNSLYNPTILKIRESGKVSKTEEFLIFLNDEYIAL